MKYFWLGVLAVLSSCQSEENCCTVIDTSIAISYRDAQGNDWLRAHNVTEGGMEVYALLNGQKTRMYNGYMDAPKSIRLGLSPDSSITVLTLYANGGASANGEALTLLEFPDHSVDTVQCRFEYKGLSTLCKNVRYNGQQRWNYQSQDGRYFTVTK